MCSGTVADGIWPFDGEHKTLQLNTEMACSCFLDLSANK